MEVGVNYNSLMTGNVAVQNAATKREQSKFDDLVKSMQAASSGKNSAVADTSATANGSARADRFQKPTTTNVASEQILEAGRLNGDWKSGFGGTYTTENDKAALPRGAAANQAGVLAGGKQTIDRTSKLYEQALELESYFVKIMLSTMRDTIQKSDLYGNNFASKTYEDMLYDEYAVQLTKNAGFGLADEIYLQLNRVDVQA